MTILRSGTTQQYADNWARAFGGAGGGGKKKKAGKKTKAAGKKSKKKAVKKASAKNAYFGPFFTVFA